MVQLFSRMREFRTVSPFKLLRGAQGTPFYRESYFTEAESATSVDPSHEKRCPISEIGTLGFSLIWRHWFRITLAHVNTSVSPKTPIVYAIEKRYTKMTEQLLINGADIKNPKVLFTAVQNGSLKIVEDLLKNGADPNVIDYSDLFDRVTPLHAAVYWNQVEVAKLLIKYGAIINIKGGWETTPLIDAIQNGDTRMTELLLINGADMKDPDVLYTAVQKGNLKIVEDLLKDGADPNMMNDGLTPLHAAVKWNQVEMAKLLINCGAKVNVKLYTDAHPIVYAIIDGNTKMIELLLTNESDIKDDPTVLCAAASYGCLKLVEYLLKSGADPNMTDNSSFFKGLTPLLIAIRWNHVEMAKLLLNYGADVNLKGSMASTTIDHAIEYSYIEMIELLLTNGADIIENVISYSLRVDYSITKILNQHIAKVKAAGLYVSKRNLLWISNNYEINNFLNECEAEIQIMKSEKIDNSCASFYDILTKYTSELAKNESIVQALKSDDYKTKFPIYASMIDSRFRRGLERKELLEQVWNKFLHSLPESLPELPLLCTEKIFSYLSDRDLRILLVACEIFNKYIYL